MSNPNAVGQMQAECQAMFFELAALQEKIRAKVSFYADEKNLKGNELVGWLGEVYGKLLFDGKLVHDNEEHDFVASDGRRVSVKTRKGWGNGWKRTSAIPKIEGPTCPTDLLFVHLNDDYSIDRIWLLEWSHLLDTNRFKKHTVRGSHRSFIFDIHEENDKSCVVFGKDSGPVVPTAIRWQPPNVTVTYGGSMQEFRDRGAAIRKASTALVLEFMKNHPDANPDGPGIRQAEIFRECGFGWGAYPKATPSNQQYWIVALLNELQAQGLVMQVSESGPWRRTN